MLTAPLILGVRNNYAAVVDPTASDDSTKEYAVGSVWINCATGSVFTCVDATAGAAVWNTGGGDVDGPTGGSTDHAAARWSGAGGHTLQDSGVIISDADDVSATSFSVGASKLDAAEFGYLDGLDQALAQASSPQFAGLTLTGNITMPEDGWVGLGAALVRVAFDGSADRLLMTGRIVQSQAQIPGTNGVASAQFGQDFEFTASAASSCMGMYLTPNWSGNANGKSVVIAAAYVEPTIETSLSAMYGDWIVPYVGTGATAGTVYDVYASLDNDGTVTTWYGIYIGALTGNAPGTAWAVCNASGKNWSLGTAAEKLIMRDSAIYIASLDNSYLDIVADGAVRVGAHTFLANAAGLNTVAGYQVALATNATDGFLYVPACAGTPTGTPTAYTGKVALVWDTSGDHLHLYDGEWLGVCSEVSIPFEFDNAGAPIPVGEQKTVFEVPADCEVVSWALYADAAGSITVDVWKDTYANYPPTNADSICGGAEPAIAADVKATSAALGAWTKTLAKGDVLKFCVDACAAITHVKGYLRCKRK